jgi:hypothetical protein
MAWAGQTPHGARPNREGSAGSPALACWLGAPPPPGRSLEPYSNVRPRGMAVPPQGGQNSAYRSGCFRISFCNVHRCFPFAEHIFRLPPWISSVQNSSCGTVRRIPRDPAGEITADPSETTRKDEAVDLQRQKELSELSSRGCMLVAERSRHYVQDDRPDLVMASLQGLISEVRDPSGSQNLCPQER